MPLLEYVRKRMVTSDTPFIHELQAYYKPKLKTYSFPVCGDIIRRIDQVQFSDALMKHLKSIRKEQVKQEKALADVDFPDKRLEDYQKTGANWLMEIKKGILADDQGSGKTVTSLAAAHQLNVKHTVIICSKGKRQEWKEETLTWTGSDAYIVPGVDRGPDDAYMVTNYDYAVANWAEIGTWADLVIIDEAHILRNRKTQMFKALKKLCNRCTYVFLLTASPTVNTISDFWPLLCICDEARFGSYWGFAFRFCEILMDTIGMKVGNTKASEVENLNLILNQYVLSRESNDVLPNPEWKLMDFVLPKVQRDLYTQMSETMETEYDSGNVCVALTPLSQITRLRQLALCPKLIFQDYRGWGKLKLLPDLIKEWDGQTLIFTQYAELIRLATEYLEDHNISATYITNKFSDKRREKNKTMFKGGSFRVMSVTYKMGGEGLDFTNASQAIFLEYPWNPAGIRHAYKRILRRGQMNKELRFVVIHAKETIEDHILDILREKKKVTIEEIMRRKNDQK